MKAVTISIFILLVSCLQSTGVARAESGRSVGNGGGGLFRNGNYLTFESAEIPLRAYDAAVIKPLLEKTIAKVKELGLGEPFESELIQGLQVTASRQYFDIEVSDIKPKTFKKLLAQYGEIKASLPVPQNSKVILFAMTSGNDSYLLPSFYKLPDDQGKMAILFHEAIRKQFPKVSTPDVVRLEMAFEDDLRGKNDIGIYEQIANILDGGQPLLALKGYALHDIETGALGNLIGSAGQIRLSALFENSVDTGSFPDAVVNIDSVPLPFDQARWLSVLTSLQSRFPKSRALEFFAKNYDKIKLYVSVMPGCEGRSFGPADLNLGSRSFDFIPARRHFNIDPTFESRTDGKGVLADMLRGNRVGNNGCYSEIDLLIQNPLYPDPAI